MTKPLLCDVLHAIANFVNIMNRDVLELHATETNVSLKLAASGSNQDTQSLFVIELDLTNDTGTSTLWELDHHGIIEPTDDVVTGTVRETWAGFAGSAKEWEIV